MLVDAGTAYTKMLDRGELVVVRSDRVPADLSARMATGHNAGRVSREVVNELVALARGGLVLIGEPDFTLVDVGCRDIKRVSFQGRRYAGCGWNDSCGSMTGFTLDLLARYFQLDYASVPPTEEALDFTCGVFGISEMFDRISGGAPVDRAVAGLVRGLAERVYEFAGRPLRLFLSGGLCENPLFLRSFPCPVEPLGRAVLLRGLEVMANRS